MKVAIVSSFAPVTDLLVENSVNPEPFVDAGVPGFRGKLYGKETFIVPISPEADVTALVQALRVNVAVDFLISVGTAEPAPNQLKAGDVLVVNEALGKPKDASSTLAQYRGDQRLVDLALSAQDKVFEEEPGFRVLSGRTIAPELVPAGPAQNQELNPYALDGNGAGLAQACEEAELPHVLIRVMVPVEDSADREQFQRDGSKNVYWVVKSVLEPSDFGDTRRSVDIG